MMTRALLTTSLLAFVMGACSAPVEPEAPVEVSDQPANASATSETIPADGESENPEPRETDLLAAQMCDAVEGDFASLLPAGTGFAGRVSGSARVHLAWNYEGEVEQHIVHTPSLELDDRLPFDIAVGDFQRRNMGSADPGRDLAGMLRRRDGSFCVIQTEAAAIEPLIAAFRTVEPLINAE